MGKLFVIDGTDGSGKQTQFDKLKERLIEEKVEFKDISFPRYESESSALVKMYLAGKFGENAKDVSPYIASTFYAADRYATYKVELEEYYNNDGIILADRYTTANMVHQAGKIADFHERKNFLNWLWDFEFNLYKLPIPTKVFFLNMPPEYALKLMEGRKNKITNDDQKDIHERDEQHIIDSYNAAKDLVNEYGWHEIKCVANGEVRAIEDIHEEIYVEVLNIVKKRQHNYEK